MFQFRTDGYASEANAKRKLLMFAPQIGAATNFVAVQNGRYFPVVVHRDGLALNIPALCMAGITVLN